jgi:hypothetical protein
MLYNIETANPAQLREHAQGLGLTIVAERLANPDHAVDGQAPQTLFVLHGRLINRTVLTLLCMAHGQQCLAMYDLDTGKGECPGPKPWPFDLSFFAQS